MGAASEEEEIRLGDLVRSGRAAVDEGADDFNLAVAVLKGASEQGKLFKDRGGTEAVEGVLGSLNKRLAKLLAEVGCNQVLPSTDKRGTETLRRIEALLRSLAVTATTPRTEAVGSRVARGPDASGSGRCGGSRGRVERRAGGE